MPTSVLSVCHRLITTTGLLVMASGCGGARPEAPDAPPSAGLEAPVSPPASDPLHATTSTRANEIHGELLAIEGTRVLRVWGTPTEMGFAHGALLRDSIIEIVDGYALDVIPAASLDAAGVVYTSVAEIPPRLREEAQGVIEGMESAGGAEIPRLGRELRVADLLVLNAMTDLLAIGCSSVSAWGTATEDAPALAGSPVMVRNLDWSDDPELLRNQLVFVFRPDDPKRQPVVSVAFAGYLGCLSCMNEAGVSALFNMGYGDGAADPAQALRGFAPANLLLRDALERRDVDGDGETTADDVEAVWRQQSHAGSYILHLLEPRRRTEVAPARVLEVEADGVVTRRPQASELGGQILAATNHLREKTAPSQCSRYTRVERTVAARRHHFDRDALWQLGTELRLEEVVHTLLVEPEARRIGAWLRGPAQSHRSPSSPVWLEWDALVGDDAKR